MNHTLPRGADALASPKYVRFSPGLLEAGCLCVVGMRGLDQHSLIPVAVGHLEEPAREAGNLECEVCR